MKSLETLLEGPLGGVLSLVVFGLIVYWLLFLILLPIAIVCIDGKLSRTNARLKEAVDELKRIAAQQRLR